MNSNYNFKLNSEMEDSIEQRLNPMFNSDGIFQEEAIHVERIKAKLTPQEFEKHLEE